MSNTVIISRPIVACCVVKDVLLTRLLTRTSTAQTQQQDKPAIPAVSPGFNPDPRSCDLDCKICD